MFKDCEIVFDERPNGIFYSGEVVKGHIKINLEKSKYLTDLVFKAKGSTKCQWVESYGATPARMTVIFDGKEWHFKSSMSLLQDYPRDAQNKNTVHLEAGPHFFDFSMKLPESCATSFESREGSVSYKIKLKAIRPNKSDDEYKTAYTVIAKCDLNTIPNCIDPVSIDTKRSFNSFLVSKGALILTVSLPASGFLPGQHIPIRCSIDNASGVLVKEVVFSFLRIINYNATSPWNKTKVKCASIVKYAGKGINKKEKTSYTVSFPVPATPPSTLVTSLPIVIEYVLKVKAKVSSMHSNAVVKVPLVIGNIPFKDYRQFYGFGLDDHSSTSKDGPTTSTANEYDRYWELPPPTYEECISEDKKTKKKDTSTDELIFRPRYPVFCFPEPTTTTEIKEKL